MRFSALLAIFLCALPAPAAWAQNDADRLEQAGLLGEWSVDCRRPASTANAHVFIRREDDGSVLAIDDFGEEAMSFIARLSFVRQNAPGQIVVHEILLVGPDEGEVFEMTIVIEAGRHRILASKSPRHGELIRDAIRLRDGTPTRWQQRCSDGRRD